MILANLTQEQGSWKRDLCPSCHFPTHMEGLLVIFPLIWRGYCTFWIFQFSGLAEKNSCCMWTSITHVCGIAQCKHGNRNLCCLWQNTPWGAITHLPYLTNKMAVSAIAFTQWSKKTKFLLSTSMHKNQHWFQSDIVKFDIFGVKIALLNLLSIGTKMQIWIGCVVSS